MTKSPFTGLRVALRSFAPDDAAALGAYLNDPLLTGRRYIPWGFPDTLPLSAQQVAAVIQKWAEDKDSLNLAVARLDDGELIGHAGYSWEWDPHCPSLWAVVAPAYRRQGYGTEVIDLLLRIIFDSSIAHTVTCWIDDWNEAGLRFIEHCGFRLCGQMRRTGVRQGQFYDATIYDMLRAEWKARGGYADAA